VCQSSHFGYEVMSLNQEHDLLSLVLHLPAIGFLDHLGTYHVQYYQYCLCHWFAIF
jgi:hypothetical protein